jgi:hypothetical protein
MEHRSARGRRRPADKFDEIVRNARGEKIGVRPHGRSGIASSLSLLAMTRALKRRAQRQQRERERAERKGENRGLTPIRPGSDPHGLSGIASSLSLLAMTSALSELLLGGEASASEPKGKEVSEGNLGFPLSGNWRAERSEGNLGFPLSCTPHRASDCAQASGWQNCRQAVSRSLTRRRAIACVCIWHTRDSLTPSTSPISRRLSSCS